MKTVVLSSYPRSGNTWLRFMLATALLGERPDSQALLRLLPDIHAGVEQNGPWSNFPVLLLKSHLLPDMLHRELLNMEALTAGQITPRNLDVIHIIRNPFDCAVSITKFVGTPPEQVGTRLSQLMEINCANSDFKAWGFGSWYSNNAQWLMRANAEGNIRFLRYEDMLADPGLVLRTIFGHYQLQNTLPFDEVVALCSAESMRRAEEKEIQSGQKGIFTQLHETDPEKRHVNAATSGGYRKVMTPAQIERGLETFGPLMQQYGYDLADYAP